jgi:hypothetical protein
MRTLAERVAYLRRCAGIGCREADRLAGTHRGFSAEVENGNRLNPKVGSVGMLAELYGAPKGWLLTGDGKAPSKRSVARAVETARVAKAVAA